MKSAMDVLPRRQGSNVRVGMIDDASLGLELGLVVGLSLGTPDVELMKN
jgi:hypothetical protein